MGEVCLFSRDRIDIDVMYKYNSVVSMLKRMGIVLLILYMSLIFMVCKKTPTAPTLMTPKAPSNLEVEVEYYQAPFYRIYIKWKDNSDDESGFKVERRKGDSGSWGEIFNTSANITDVESLINLVITYYYRVRAYNDYGYSDYSNVVIITP